MNTNHYTPWAEDALSKHAYTSPTAEALDLSALSTPQDLLASLSAEAEIDDFEFDGDL